MRIPSYAIAFLAIFTFLAVGQPGTANALGPCTPPGAPPACNGGCPDPGDMCVPDGGTGCECLPSAFTPCGEYMAAPECLGECPPLQICEDVGDSVCACIPTLSQWGIIGMSFVMLGSVLWLRRRRESDLI